MRLMGVFILVLILLSVFFVIMNVILFRRLLFRCRKKENNDT